MIITDNLVIDAELCKRLDKNFYSNNPRPNVIKKSNVIRIELLNLISKYDNKTATLIKDKCLFYLYSSADRIKSNTVDVIGIERGLANLETAHNQLKNYK